MLDKLEVKDWLKLNAQLQVKKNALRKALKARGILKKEGNNTFDKYKYFTEAQYKELFTELFSEFGLELNFDELEYNTFEGSEKQANGRMPKLRFYLFDTETGFYETTTITGEGIDKGDKAGYKAYTGALKYYLADKFMVATGDDPEVETPDYKMNTVKKEAKALGYNPEKKATAAQCEFIRNAFPPERLTKMLAYYKVARVEDLSALQAGEALNMLKKEPATA